MRFAEEDLHRDRALGLIEKITRIDRKNDNLEKNSQDKYLPSTRPECSDWRWTKTLKK